MGRKAIVTLIAVIGAALLLCLGLAFMTWMSFPPTEWLTRYYFDAVVSGDLARATLFSPDSKASMFCTNASEARARDDIQQFGAAAVRNVSVLIRANDGNDDAIEYGSVDFEYRKPGESVWRAGHILVQTRHYGLGFRYTCGAGEAPKMR